MKRMPILLLLLLGLGLVVVPAFADTAPLDPQLYTCQSCTAPPGGDPNVITNTGGFNVGWDSKVASQGTLLMIVGVFNSTTAPQMSFGMNTINPGGTAIYGWNGSASGTTFKQSNGSTDAYALLGITPEDGGSSEQFGNWETGLAQTGFTTNPSTDFFTLFVFQITGATLPMHGSSITLDVSGAPNGSYVIGYDCEVTGTQCPKGNEGATPFTNSGLIDTALPDGGMTLMLLGGSLVGLATLRRRFSA